MAGNTRSRQRANGSASDSRDTASRDTAPAGATIRVLVNTESAEYTAIQRELVTEVNALGREPGVHVRTETSVPPAGTLAVAEAFQFVIDHKDAILLIPLAKAALEVITAVLRRRGADAPVRAKAEAPAMIVVGDHNTIVLPASPSAQRRFLATLRGSTSSTRAQPRAARPKRGARASRTKARPKAR
jgi:hypothetical protein